VNVHKRAALLWVFISSLSLVASCGGRDCDRYAKAVCAKACSCTQDPFQCYAQWQSFYVSGNKAECEQAMRDLCTAETGLDTDSCTDAVENTECVDSRFIHPMCSLSGKTELGCEAWEKKDFGCSCGPGYGPGLDVCREDSLDGPAVCCDVGPGCHCAKVGCWSNDERCTCGPAYRLSTGHGPEVSSCPATSDQITCCLEVDEVGPMCRCSDSFGCFDREIEVPACDTDVIRDCGPGRLVDACDDRI
jgi:hypothetical protein